LRRRVDEINPPEVLLKAYGNSILADEI
jgi:hypothetical protein